MKFDDPLGARNLVEAVDILSDDSHSPALATKFSLSFGDGEVSWVRLLGRHELPTVVVEFPYQRGVNPERLGAGQVGSTVIQPYYVRQKAILLALFQLILLAKSAMKLLFI